MEKTETIKKRRVDVHSPSLEAAVTLTDVSKVYDVGTIKVHALSGVTLSVPRGKFIVLLGPSGSGKTTMLNLIGGIDHPTEGEILVDGGDIGSLDEDLLLYLGVNCRW